MIHYFFKVSGILKYTNNRKVSSSVTQKLSLKEIRKLFGSKITIIKIIKVKHCTGVSLIH